MERKYIIGLDISSSCTGVVVVDSTNLDIAWIGSFETDKIKIPKGLYDHGVKLKQMGDWFYEIKEKYPPKVVVIERGFTAFNNSTQVIFRYHGLANFVFHDVPQIYYTPKSVKSTVIHGDASKQLVQDKILLEFGKRGVNLSFKNQDESDAMGVAVTYLIKNKMIDWKIDLAELSKIKPKAKKKKRIAKPIESTIRKTAKKKK